MDVGQSFGFISEDERWMNKLLVGAIMSAVPFLNFAVLGYSIQIARNVAQDEERPLPEWDNIGQFFSDGLRMIGAYLVYILPMLFLMACALIPLIISMESYDPYASSGSPDEFMPQMLIFWGFYMGCMLPYTLVIYVLWPLFSIQVARERRMGACFAFKEMWRLVRAQPMNYFLILMIMFGLYMAAMFVTIPAMVVAVLIPCVGFIIYMLVYGAALTVIFMIVGHLQGQFIKEDENMKGENPDFDPVMG